MKRALRIVSLVAVFCLVLSLSPSARARPGPSPLPPPPQPDAARFFELNRGQFDRETRFRASSANYWVNFSDDSIEFETVVAKGKNGERAVDVIAECLAISAASCVGVKSKLDVKTDRARIRFDRASVTPIPEVQVPGVSHYYRGQGAAGDVTEVPRYSRIRYPSLYPGIDLVFRFNDLGILEFDLDVSPGADPGQFGLRPLGPQDVTIGTDGSLAISSQIGAYRQSKPVVIPSDASPVPEARFSYKNSVIGIELGGPAPPGSYVIDPAISYSTFDVDDEWAGGLTLRVARDAAGDIYTVGAAINPDSAGGPPDFDVRVNKLSTTNPWTTHIGGLDGGMDIATGVAISGHPTDPKVGVVGITMSGDFTVAPKNAPVDGTLSGPMDGFAARLYANSGAVDFSTYIGGTDQGCPPPPAVQEFCTTEGLQGVAFDPISRGPGDDRNSLIVSGFTNSADLPTTPAAYQATLASVTESGGRASRDGFFSKLRPDFAAPGGRVQFLSYFGGTGDEFIDVLTKTDAAGNFWVAGMTNGVIPTTGGFQSTNNGDYDLFATRFNMTTASTPDYSTMLGGSGLDTLTDLDIQGEVATMIGDTTSDDLQSGGLGQYPALPGPPPGGEGSTDAYLAQVTVGAASQTYGTYLGGSSDDRGRGVGVSGPAGQAGQRIIASGATGSGSSFGVVNPIPGETCNQNFDLDVFMSVVDTGSSDPIKYQSCFGGLQPDWAEDLVVSGATGSEKVVMVGPTASNDIPIDDGTPDGNPALYQEFHSISTSGLSGFVTEIDLAPAAAPGTYIAFSSNRLPAPPSDQTSPSSAIWKMNPQGQGLANVTPLHSDLFDYGGTYGAPGTYEGHDEEPAISSDGRRILYSSNRNAEGWWDIYVVDKDGPSHYACRLTYDQWEERRPAWAPNGQTIAYSSNGLGTDISMNREIHVLDVSGLTGNSCPVPKVGEGQVVTNSSPAMAHAPAYSPNSGCIAYTLQHSLLTADVALALNPYMSTCIWNPQLLTTDGSFNSFPAWSIGTASHPQGRIAFASARLDTLETEAPSDVRLWIMDLDSSSPDPNLTFARLTGFTGTFTGASAPAWSPEGNKIMAYGSDYPDGDYDIFSLDPNNPDPDNPGAHHNLIEDALYGNLGPESSTRDWWPSYGPGDVGPPGL